MNLARETALLTMKLTQKVGINDFLGRHGVATPMPVVTGALPDHARVTFPSVLLNGLPIDLVVVWTIGDFPGRMPCSAYYDPGGAWYNVFYGAYGILSHEKDGTYWGYDAGGAADFDQMLEVPELDYNYLTAGQLGCPPAKRTFKVTSKTTGTKGSWDHADVTAVIPSGLHHLADAVHANPLYYSIFGFPDPQLTQGHASYEPVAMVGEMFFRRLPLPPSGERMTLAWGTMCPDTSAGRALLQTIIGAMTQLYP